MAFAQQGDTICRPVVTEQRNYSAFGRQRSTGASAPHFALGDQKHAEASHDERIVGKEGLARQPVRARSSTHRDLRPAVASSRRPADFAGRRRETTAEILIAPG
jgi:hypothetical protein